MSSTPIAPNDIFHCLNKTAMEQQYVLLGGVMNNFSIKNHEDDRHFQLSDNQVLTFDVWKFEINCLRGLIWLTWPDGNDRILQQGQFMSVTSEGLICVQAFAASSIMTRIVKKDDSRFFFRLGRQIRDKSFWPLRAGENLRTSLTRL